jgi:23S rRNA G2445 N2-methylase RlmL
LHTAREILWVLLEKRVGDIESFDKGFRGIRWNLILERRAQIHIRCNSVGSHLYHEGKIKKRGETLAKEAFLRPVDKDTADHFIDLSLRSNRMRVSISMLGRPGYIRGYKESLTSNASIRQDLAAALVIQSTEFLKAHIKDYKPEQICVPKESIFMASALDCSLDDSMNVTGIGWRTDSTLFFLK